jgi:hypothetical protein
MAAGVVVNTQTRVSHARALWRRNVFLITAYYIL